MYKIVNQGCLVVKQLTFMHIYTPSFTHSHTHTYLHSHYLVYKCSALFLTLLHSLKHLSCLVQAWIIHQLVLCTTLTALHHAKPPHKHTLTHTREPCLVSVLQRVCRWQFHTNAHTLEAQGTLQKIIIIIIIKNRTPLLSISGAAVEIVLEQPEGGTKSLFVCFP